MSIQDQISRITADRNTIRNKMVEIGVATATDNITTLATKIEGMPDNGAVSVELLEGKSYTIPRGWHSGEGVVKAKTQSKTVTPTKSQQTVASDEGYYALESVTVNPIPDAYQDVTAVTATKDQVLTGATYVTKDGTPTAGTMPNNGAVQDTLTPSHGVHVIPAGYHNGLGSVGVAEENKTFTPTKETQVHDATAKFVRKVTIDPIPDKYQDVTPVTATADKVLTGSKFVDADGVVVDGTMPDNGAANGTLTPSNPIHMIPAGYHNGIGSVGVANEEKSVTPTKSEQILAATNKYMSKVTIAPIPANFKDVTNVTAEAAHVLAGKKFLTSDTAEQSVAEGTMPNWGGVNFAIVGTTDQNNSYTIPAGYHDGTGIVSLSDVIENQLAEI